MAQLKEHLLREIGTNLCRRVRFLGYEEKENGLLSLEKFVLAGKEPARAFCRIVARDITIATLTSNHLRVMYRGEFWRRERSFLDNMMILSARKVRHCSFQWVYESVKLGYSKVMAQNTGIEELWIDDMNTFYHWPKILKAFPKLVSLTVTAASFALMLTLAPTQLICLQEIRLKLGNKSNEFLRAHKTLSEHQKKLPFLNTIHYFYTPLDDITFPDNAGNVLSVKHLKILAKIDCCTPFNYSFLTGVLKMFPSLENVEISAEPRCDCIGILQKLEFLEPFYSAFESLNLEFSIEVVYYDGILCYKKDIDQLRQFYALKGKIYESLNCFTVETSVPCKRLTYIMVLEYIEDIEKNDEDDSEN